MIQHIKQQMLLVEPEIKTLVDGDPALRKQVNLLTSINGIGNKTAWAILPIWGMPRYLSVQSKLPALLD